MKVEKLVRPNILKLKPYVSARSEYQQGLLLDANENSFGSVYQSEVKELNRYPDPNQMKIRAALSRYLKINWGKLFFGVGSDEIIDLVIRIFCEPGKSNVIIPQPTYGMYEVACHINDVKVKKCKLDKKYNLSPDSVLKLVNKNTRIIFLCSPNNPTGNLLSKEKIILLANNYKGIVFIDEAYIDFTPDNSFLPELQKFNNVIISRTFSKAWGLAAIRCGYCIAPEFIINLLFKIKAPYTISALTSSAVLTALSNNFRKDELVKNILYEKEKLISELSTIKSVINIFPSDTNFLLVEMKNVKSVFNHLNENGIRVRYWKDNPLLKDYLRITVGAKEENDLLIKSLKGIK